MIKIDEPCRGFENFDKVLKAQKAVLDVLEKGLTSTDTKVLRILEILEETHEAVKEDYQAYALFDSAFESNRAFIEWMNGLSAGQKKTFKKSLATMLPPKDAHNALIPKSDMSYKSDDYKEKTKSEWLKSKSGLSEDKMKIAQLIEEFVRQERVNVSLAQSTASVFFEYLNDSHVSSADKKILGDYVDLLAEQFAAYENLKLHELLRPINKNLSSVLSELNQLYQSQEYKKYQDTVEDFMPMMSKIENIMNKYKQITPSAMAMTVIAQQRSIAAFYPIFFQKLSDSTKKLDLVEGVGTSLLVSLKRKASSDAMYEFKQLITALGEKRRQPAICEEFVINRLLFSSELTATSDQYVQHRQGVFLENMLVLAYPDKFSIVERSLKAMGRDASKIYQAMGGKPTTGYSLDPRLFDKNRLSALSSDPALALLNAIKPIDDDFTLLDKVDALHQLIKLAKKKVINVQVNLLAKNILDRVNTRIMQHPNEDTLELKERIKAVYKTVSAGHAPRLLVGITPLESAYKDFYKREIGTPLVLPKEPSHDDKNVSSITGEELVVHETHQETIHKDEEMHLSFSNSGSQPVVDDGEVTLEMLDALVKEHLEPVKEQLQTSDVFSADVDSPNISESEKVVSNEELARRASLFASIRDGGVKLTKAQSSDKKPEPREAMLNAIRKGKPLRSQSELSDVPKKLRKSNSGWESEAIENLLARRKHIDPGDSSDTESDEEDWLENNNTPK